LPDTLTKSTAATRHTLESIRQEIDRVDDGLLDLLAQRFALVEQVKAAKQSLDIQLPLRPAREAEVLRRLVGKAKALGLNRDLLVRLWPAIFCDASLRQSGVTLNVGPGVFSSPVLQSVIRDYYPFMPIAEQADEAAAIAAAHAGHSHIAIVATDGTWLAALLQGPARVMAALPFLGSQDKPALLVIGQAVAQGSSADETLIATTGGLPRDFALKPKWQVQQGDHVMTALSGFLSEREPPLHALIRVNGRLGIKVIGRYPAPLRRAL
jgi:chorismate mutase / prephenate dehydratase